MLFHLSPKRLTFIAVCLGLCLTAALATMPMIGQTKATAKSIFTVRVLVITMFALETQPWLQHEKLPLDFKVPGAFSDVRCNDDGLCVTTTGMGKANAAASVMAVVRDPQFSFAHSYFLTAGIAGTSPSAGTLGFAAWAHWVVDWDQGHHLVPETVPGVPYGYLPDTSAGTAVFHLNEKLADLAYDVTVHVKLQDSAQAIANRQKYPGQQKQHPYVTMCDTIASDDFWAGKQLSDEAHYITSLLTKGQGRYCTTEEEDTATATVLQRMGYLDHYLNLRTASDFDQPYKGQSLQDLLSHYPGGDIALANAYLVGSTMAHYLVKHNSL
ncbi:MAG: purine nucleoside permease [Ktedonobacteraceae bacterium]|nr:purine nucleoside permease [Ktedonobacteraceae bacterium]